MYERGCRRLQSRSPSCIRCLRHKLRRCRGQCIDQTSSHGFRRRSCERPSAIQRVWKGRFRSLVGIGCAVVDGCEESQPERRRSEEETRELSSRPSPCLYDCRKRALRRRAEVGTVRRVAAAITSARRAEGTALLVALQVALRLIRAYRGLRSVYVHREEYHRIGDARHRPSKAHSSRIQQRRSRRIGLTGHPQTSCTRHSQRS